LTRGAGALVAAAALLWLGQAASAATFAVGVDRSTSLSGVAARLRAYGPVTRGLAPLHVLVVRTPSAKGMRRIRGVRWVEWLGARSRRLAFIPADPLAGRQWYLQQDHAFDFWPELPLLPPVKVAVVDSGIDLTHPDLVGRILLAKSFVGGSAADTQGHGTFVAGEIAATLDNAEGIAGIAFPAQLLVAKVVRQDGSISLDAEARAIRWAADRGARVINLSFGGLRDPRNPSRDTYSALEAAAVAYAVQKGAVVVAAVGNSDDAPESPWPYASYPAALPHVIGVASLAHDGSVSTFSNRDAVFDDIAAPGEDIFSTLPRALTRGNPGCADQGYSDCAPDDPRYEDYRHAEGTSFAAPQVTAAAALVLAERPRLTPDQVTNLLERTADDANASNGCVHCPLLRDSLTGWGRLDIAKTLAVVTRGSPPPADRYETNDDAGATAARLRGARGTIAATIDYWDDPTDVYALQVAGGRRLTVSLAGAAETSLQLVLWSPRTRTLLGASRRLAVARSAAQGPRQRIAYAVPRGKGGRYYVQVRVSAPGGGPYSLHWVETR
jgi:subtilisin family serine protease